MRIDSMSVVLALIVDVLRAHSELKALSLHCADLHNTTLVKPGFRTPKQHLSVGTHHQRFQNRFPTIDEALMLSPKPLPYPLPQSPEATTAATVKTGAVPPSVPLGKEYLLIPTSPPGQYPTQPPTITGEAFRAICKGIVYLATREPCLKLAKYIVDRTPPKGRQIAAYVGDRIMHSKMLRYIRLFICVVLITFFPHWELLPMGTLEIIQRGALGIWWHHIFFFKLLWWRVMINDGLMKSPRWRPFMEAEARRTAGIRNTDPTLPPGMKWSRGYHVQSPHARDPHAEKTDEDFIKRYPTTNSHWLHKWASFGVNIQEDRTRYRDGYELRPDSPVLRPTLAPTPKPKSVVGKVTSAIWKFWGQWWHLIYSFAGLFAVFTATITLVMHGGPAEYAGR